MRLDFNVLWVEDQKDQVEAQKDRISMLLRKEGFRLQVQFADSVDAAAGFLSDDIYGDHIDLVLMDYDLGPGRHGDEGLEVVRHEFPYKDIIFYSGQKAADLAQMVTDRHIQGVFVCHRPELPDTVFGVFENLVRKVLDIDHARGIVMGATSDIDEIVVSLLSSAFERSSDDDKKALLDDLPRRIKKKKKSFDQALANASKVQHPADLTPLHAVFTSDDRFRLLRKLFEIGGLHTEKGGAFDDYRDNVVPKRNDLAHITVRTEGFSRRLFDRAGGELTSANMKELRLKLLQFHDDLVGLL